MSLDLDYIILNAILLLTFCISGWKIQRGEGFWKNACWMIFLFTFVLGSRYLRGNDYAHYSQSFLYEYVRGNQWLFYSLNIFLKNIGFDRFTCFYAYSFIEILCAVIFLKRYRCYGKYIFPSFLVAIIVFDEYQIRQALSFSFIFLYMRYLFNLQWDSFSYKVLLRKRNLMNIGLAVFCAFIAGGIHSFNLIIAVMIAVFYCFIRVPFPYMLTIPLVFFCQYVVSSIFNFSIFSPIINYFSDSELLGIYANNADRWFSADGFEEKYNRNVLVGFCECIGVCSLFYLGGQFFKKITKCQEYVTMYNIFVFGILFQMSFRQLELFNRIGGDLALMWFLPLSLVLYYRKKLIACGCKKIYFYGLLWFAYEFMRYLFLRGNMTLFLWDK